MSRETSTREPTFRAAGMPMSETQQQPAQDVMCYLRSYAREKPDVAALWCFGIGFVLGWKLKLW